LNNFVKTKSVHLEHSQNEINVACLNDNSRVYIHDEEADTFEADEVKSFVANFVAGKLKPHLKSELIPKNNDKRLVKIAVGKTIESILEKSTKAIVLAFVSPNGFGDLMKFESKFEQLATEFSSNPGVVFYQIEVFRNDYPEYFKPSLLQPSVYFVPVNDKKNPVFCNMQGDDWMSLPSLKAFVEDNLKEKEKERDEL
jgi:hypothetical protein